MGSYVFSFSFICIFIPFLVLSHMYVFLIPSVRSLRVGSRLWKANIDQNWNLFYHYLFQRTPVIYNFSSQENVYLFAIYFHKNTKLGRDNLFTICIWAGLFTPLVKLLDEVYYC